MSWTATSFSFNYPDGRNRFPNKRIFRHREKPSTGTYPYLLAVTHIIGGLALESSPSRLEFRGTWSWNQVQQESNSGGNYLPYKLDILKCATTQVQRSVGVVGIDGPKNLDSCQVCSRLMGRNLILLQSIPVNICHLQRGRRWYIINRNSCVIEEKRRKN